MSPIVCKKQLAPLPQVERGFAYNIYTSSPQCKKFDRMIYYNKKSVVMRDLEDFTESVCFAGEHKLNVKVAAYSPSGEWVASGDEGGTVLVWGQGNFIVKATHEVLSAIDDLAWDPEGKRLLVGGKGNPQNAKCITWDAGNKIGDFDVQTQKIISVDYKPTRPYRAVCASEDNTVGFYAGPPFKKESIFKEHTRYPNKVKFSPSGDNFVTVGSDNKIFLFDGKTGEKMAELASKEDGHTGAIYSFAWSPDSKHIVTCSADKTAKVWDVENGNVATTYTFSENPTIADMQLGAVWHKEYLITLSNSGAINYLDPGNPSKPARVVMGHKDKVTSFCVDTSNKRFFTSDSSGVICAWNDYVASWFTGAGHGGKSIRCIDVNSDRSKVLSVGSDSTARWNDVKSLTFGEGGIQLDGVPQCCACSPTDPSLAVVATTKNILILIKDDVAVATLDVGYTATIVKFTEDGSQLIVNGHKNQTTFYAVSSDVIKESRKDEELHAKTPVSICLLGDKYITTGPDKIICVRDINTGELVNNKWEYHTGNVKCIAKNPSGTKLASVGNDLNIMVWQDTVNFEAKRETHKMSHREGIAACDFIDDDTLITVGEDGFLKVWSC